MARRMGRQPSVMTHQFSQVPGATIPRSSFNRSHGLKTTLNAGWLVPIYADEALPGDTFSLRMTGFGRMATPIKPIMDNLFMETFFFAVPIRQIWDNFQKFMGEQENPTDSVDFVVPQITTTNVAEQSVSDYLGIPIGNFPGGLSFNALHHRAYNLIGNEWFRDQNLQTSRQVPKGDGPDDEAIYNIRVRSKKHDYFTSALPWPQKGPTVNLPLGATAPIELDGSVADGTLVQFNDQAGQNSRRIRKRGSDDLIEFQNAASTALENPVLVANLSTASAATINQLRQAFQIQKLQERDARGGTRYTEIIRSHFGVISPDARLQRPEYLGGGSSYININPVEQTSQTNADGQNATTPQGNLAATGTVGIHGHGFTRSFTEHCVILGLVNVRADLTYQQGVNRMFSRRTKYDYYWPALSSIGEQSILNKEIFAAGVTAGTDETVWGYQERYAEYRYKPSLITGKFRSKAQGSLDAWHLSENFGSLPNLNTDFIQSQPPISRVVAVQDEPHFLLDCHFNLRCARPMPVHGVPGLIDHF